MELSFAQATNQATKQPETPTQQTGTPSNSPAFKPETTEVPFSELRARMAAAQAAGFSGGLTRVAREIVELMKANGVDTAEFKGSVANLKAKQIATSRDGVKSVYFAIPFNLEGLPRVQWGSVGENDLPTGDIVPGTPVTIKVSPNTAGNPKYYFQW